MSHLLTFMPLGHWLLTFAVTIGAMMLPIAAYGQSPPQNASTSQEAMVDARVDGDRVLQTLQQQELSLALDLLSADADDGLDRADRERLRLPQVAAGIHRELMQVSAEQRFEILAAWSLPTDMRASVRLLVTPVPHEAPPKMFARVLGQRPRDESFPIAAVGTMPGLFCSAWMLVQAADEVGRLSRLATDLQKLRDESVPGADAVWLLTQIASRRGDITAVVKHLSESEEALSARVEMIDELSAVDWANVVVAVVGLREQDLQPVCERILNHYARQPTPEQPLLRLAHATAVQSYRGASPATVLYQHRLKHWTTAEGSSATAERTGAPPPIWLTHEEHLLHLAGGWNDTLLCRYPLTGEFEFVCETQTGGLDGTEGGMVYGGLHYEVAGASERMTIWDADGGHPIVRYCPFVRSGPQATFNRMSIKSTSEAVAFEANFHPMWKDDAAAQTSPWLGLRSHGHRRPVFRNLRLVGQPVIPRQVRLFADDQLRGWQSAFYPAKQPPFSSELETQSQRDQPHSDWQVTAGTVVGVVDPANSKKPSLLQYQRPLLEGESIRYEFFFDADAVAVHPALGRMAFLLQPDGVRVRWLTERRWDWTGLPPDNAALDPLSRRGPRAVPLVANDWNSVTMTVNNSVLDVTLNDQLIYQTKLENDWPPVFGLYRDGRGASAKLRHAVMTGPWPEQLPEDFLQQPLAVVEDSQN